MTRPVKHDGSGMPRERLLELLSAYCDSSISPSELRVLEDELLSSPDSRACYRAYLAHEATLEWEFSSIEVLKRIHTDELEDCERLSGGAGSQQLSAALDTARHRSTGARRWTIAVSFVAGFVLLWVGFAIPGFLPGLDRQEPRAGASAGIARIEALDETSSWYIESLPGAEHPSASVGDRLRVVMGAVRLRYRGGSTVVLSAPTVLEVTGADSLRLVQGGLRGQVAKGSEGFVVTTPRASIVDYGTEFGVSVNEAGVTDVAVFEGEVGVESADSAESIRLKMGDGVHLDEHGAMSRLVAFESSRFPSEDPGGQVAGNSVFAAIRDNTAPTDHMKYYEIIVGGMREDARAYVDRESHQWNGLTESGMPSYLVGADYVRMFNNDKIDEQIEVEVSISGPAVVYVLVDDRNAIPVWLSSEFEDTNDNIGLDTGPFTDWDDIRRLEENTIGEGPGDSIDGVFSIWSKRVNEPCVLKLGAAETPHNRTNMYALAAVPIE